MEEPRLSLRIKVNDIFIVEVKEDDLLKLEFSEADAFETTPTVWQVILDQWLKAYQAEIKRLEKEN